MKQAWLLYADADFAVNQDFAAMMNDLGRTRGLAIQPVCLSALTLGMDEHGSPFCRKNGRPALPDLVISRQRDPLVSRHFECMGIPVFNNSQVCATCNDKRVTYQFLRGLPMPQTMFFPLEHPASFPVVVKPACSHGGDRVQLAQDPAQWQSAISAIRPQPALCQQVVSEAGQDLRIYVVDGQMIAGVLRRAQKGIVSNYKLGGSVSLHALGQEERALAQQVIDRFEQANAHLWFAGVDLLYHNGHPVVGEVEDVVGSRMLYQTSGIDIAALYLDALCKGLK